LKKKKNKIKKANFIGNSEKEFQKYKTGALAGALIGGFTAIIAKKKVIWGIVIGALVGGYVNNEINKEHGNLSFRKKLNNNVR